MCFICISAKSMEYTSVVPSVANEEVYDFVSGLQIKRQIAGGTVFKVNYDSNVPIRLKGAFEYACHILEEYIPTCTPITVSVGWKSLNSSIDGKKTISEIDIRTVNLEESLGDTPTSQMKRIMLNETSMDGIITFIDSISDFNIIEDINSPDIRIVYNSYLNTSYSYTIDETPTNKYDFVTIALRDLLRGLGVVSNLIKDPAKNVLKRDTETVLPFEYSVAYAIRGNNEEEIFKNATKGEAYLSGTSLENAFLTLYAPNNWIDNVSLNYFVPGNNCKISSVLRYDFGKGAVIRDLADKSGVLFANNYLGWGYANCFVGEGSGDITSEGGSTDNFIPFNSNLLNNRSTIIESEISKHPEESQQELSVRERIIKYFKQFHPFYPGASNDELGGSVSLLKKDGTWDVVYHEGAFYPAIDTRTWTLHCENDEYARTCDGYLRCRWTNAYFTGGPEANYSVKYYVVDFLPQAIEATATEVDIYTPVIIPPRNSPARLGAKKKNLYVSYKNLEGTKLVLAEIWEEGKIDPYYVYVEDFKSGYTTLELDNTCKQTITFYSYNDNGMTKGEVIEYEPTYLPWRPLANCVQKANTLQLVTEENQAISGYKYMIYSLSSTSAAPILSGTAEDMGEIDISSLSAGLYAIRYSDENGDGGTLKFQVR